MKRQDEGAMIKRSPAEAQRFASPEFMVKDAYCEIGVQVGLKSGLYSSL